ncbi:MAG: hypothetical protein IIW86_02900 [Clostridia bacterium]|nr:hypothetical protein [Clostridia bacterium]MBQ5900790.1 hypothetical protein [Clostridia bacterium]
MGLASQKFFNAADGCWYEIVPTLQNDKWITVHPNGEGTKGTHLLVKDGETAGQAIERKFGNNQPELFGKSYFGKSELYGKKADERRAKEYEKAKNKPIGIEDLHDILADEKKLNKFAGKLFDDDAKRVNITPELRKELYGLLHSNAPLTAEEWVNRVKNKLKKLAGGKKEEKGDKIYQDFAKSKDVMSHLVKSVEAQKADNPDAKIGDTIIELDSLMSNYTDRLSTEDYNKWDSDKAEKAVFDKLKEIEKEYGFKEDSDIQKWNDLARYLDKEKFISGYGNPNNKSKNIEISAKGKKYWVSHNPEKDITSIYEVDSNGKKASKPVTSGSLKQAHSFIKKLRDK